MGRYVKELEGGKLIIDRAKFNHAVKLDAKYLLPQVINSPARRHCLTKEYRIRTQVLLCWVPILSIRIAEMETEQSWN